MNTKPTLSQPRMCVIFGWPFSITQRPVSRMWSPGLSGRLVPVLGSSTICTWLGGLVGMGHGSTRLILSGSWGYPSGCVATFSR